MLHWHLPRVPALVLSTTLLASAGAFAQIGSTGFTAPAPASSQTPEHTKTAPALNQLAPLASGGVQSDATLPTECGGGRLPDDTVSRENLYLACLGELDRRTKVAKALADFRKAQTEGRAGLALPEASDAVNALSSRSTPSVATLRVTDEGPNGVSADDGRRRQVASNAPTGGIGVPDISSLSELTLVGGGCGDVCVAIFRAGEKTISVQRIGEPIALNAQVTAITGKGSNISVTVTLRKPGVDPATKEFRL